MKINLLLLILLISGLANAQIVIIPNAQFKNKLLAANNSNTIAKNLAGDYFKIDANNDGEIQNSEALQVSSLDISWSQINAPTLIGIESFTNLEYLKCSNNIVANLDVTALSKLKTLLCGSQFLATLNVQGLNLLEHLNAAFSTLTSLNLQGLSSLKIVELEYNDFSTLNVQNLFNLEKLVCQGTELTSLNVQGLLNLKLLNITGTKITSINLQNLVNLKNLYAVDALLTSLDVQGLTNLELLHIGKNNIQSINLQGLTNLKDINVVKCQLTALDVQDAILLEKLECSNNSISTLQLQNNPNLTYLDCSYMQLTSLDLQNKLNLDSLLCNNNSITALELDDLPNVTIFNCSFNLLTFLDVNNMHKLIGLRCSSNQLVSLFIKNGQDEELNFFNNNTLTNICADESQLVEIQEKLNNFGLENCSVGSYCTFNPGGKYYTIQGSQKLISGSETCEISNTIFPNFKCIVTTENSNGVEIETQYISNTSGQYNISVMSGSYILSPILENSEYYTVNPASLTVNFPEDESPFLQNFCITANGVYNDLEISMLPINTAIPGLNAIYKLIFKNNGTTTQSGSINLNFNENTLDFVSSNPTVASQQIGLLTWNFSDLAPFEVREIDIVINLNTPMENPALNDGDTLNYITNIYGQMDETPSNNIFYLNQRVVNSYDPNDKTCLEGESINPNMAGKYVHYLIRFENLGTANAQNVVVKDIIDMEKYDISTLIPLKGSHNFETRISETNRIEFIFENIQLPFDDANNDGYVAFKIKTKSDLVLGDSFANLANIHFDYNFPVITNNYITTLETTLGLPDNANATKVIAYPNPVKDVLNLIIDQAAIKIEVYDMAGRILSSNFISNNQIDLSNLKTGNYMIKVFTENGSKSMKIVKE